MELSVRLSFSTTAELPGIRDGCCAMHQAACAALLFRYASITRHGIGSLTETSGTHMRGLPRRVRYARALYLPTAPAFIVRSLLHVFPPSADERNIIVGELP